MTECDKCSLDFEETDMVIVQEKQLMFVCKECYQLYIKNITKVKPTSIKP
jgi:uncharacterized Zn finger protein